MRNESATYKNSQVLLELRYDQLIFVVSTNNGEALHFCSQVSKTRDILENGPMSGAKLERAIAQIEDQIMPITRSLRAHSELKISGFELKRVICLLPECKSNCVPIESVEELFNQLADYAGGNPVAWHHPLPPIHAALALVSLREVMHHARYHYVSLLEDAG